MSDDEEFCEVCGNYTHQVTQTETGEYVCIDCQQLKEKDDSID